MKNLCLLLTLCVLASCSKDTVDVESGQNKLNSRVDFSANGVVASYNDFTIQTLNFPFAAFNIPGTAPVIRIETVTLKELDSFHTSSQNVSFRYYAGNNTYVADNTVGDGYIVCLLNRNSESNVNIRDGSGNIKPALKREENVELKFTFRARNQVAPFDTIRVTGGKLTRSGYYYVY